jgi:hypothetical protein
MLSCSKSLFLLGQGAASYLQIITSINYQYHKFTKISAFPNLNAVNIEILLCILALLGNHQLLANYPSLPWY